jgi:hypothetical protein
MALAPSNLSRLCRDKRERGMGKNTPASVAEAPADVKEKGGLSPRDGEIERLKELLKEIRIEVAGVAETYQQLADVLYEATNEAVRHIADHLDIEILECDEESDSINYAKGIGFSWTRTTWCIGIVRGYHVIAEVSEGYNGGEGRVKLESIELIKGDVNER